MIAAGNRIIDKPYKYGGGHGRWEDSGYDCSGSMSYALHGGGLIFLSESDPNVMLIRYWISRPMPQGQDEFSAAANAMFTPADPNVGTCNTQ